MKTRYGTSPWIADFPASRRPAYDRFRGELTTEVAIIGGGLTGCALAFSLAQAGLRPVLFEADRIGQSGAGRSAGLLASEPGPTFRDLQQAHGLRVARMVFETWRRASLDAAALLRRTGIRCQLAPTDSVRLAGTDGARVLQKDFEARDSAGVESSWLTPAQLRKSIGLQTAAGLRVRAGFVLDPYRACVGLITKAVARKARVFERTRARSVRASSNHVEIGFEGGGLVRAATVVVATGVATAEFKPLRRHFKSRQRYLTLTEPLDAARRRQLFPDSVTIDDAQSGRTVRWTEDHRLIIAGGDQDEVAAARREAAMVQRTGQLMYELLTMYPVISGLHPEFGWDVGYGLTADGLPYIGPHRNYPRHLFALGGDDSSTGAFLSARLLTRRLLGEAQKGDEVFGWTR